MNAITTPTRDSDGALVEPPLAVGTARNDEFFLGCPPGDAPDNHGREWWQREADQEGFDLHSVVELCLDIIACRLFESPFMCACRLDDERRKPAPRRKPTPRPTPAVVVEAVLHTIRERGVGALKEGSNVERLRRCDAAARTEINQRIAKMGGTDG